MSLNYLLANALSIVHNARVGGNNTCVCVCPYSKVCENVLNVIKEQGYLDYVKVVDVRNGVKAIEVGVKVAGTVKLLQSFKLVSLPSRRVYKNVEELRSSVVAFKQFRVIVLSTSHGIMNIQDAIERNIGGEVLCEVFCCKE